VDRTLGLLEDVLKWLCRRVLWTARQIDREMVIDVVEAFIPSKARSRPRTAPPRSRHLDHGLLSFYCCRGGVESELIARRRDGEAGFNY